MNKVHQYAIMCAARQAQVAGIQALRHGRENDYEDVSTMQESYNRRRRVMLDAFRQMGLECFEPKGAFYCFPSVKALGLTSEEFCTRLLREQKVVCVPGDAFAKTARGTSAAATPPPWIICWRRLSGWDVLSAVFNNKRRKRCVNSYLPCWRSHCCFPG